MASTVSRVLPECDTVTTAVPLSAIAALTAWMCESVTGLGVEAELQQPVAEVLRDRRGAADAVDLDPL